MSIATCISGLLVAATLSLARTPPGFQPASNVDLIVEYNGVVPLSGVEVARNSTIPQPRIGTLARLSGRSYAVLMIDLDIPTNNPPATNSLLHWMQTGLTPATTATRITTATGQLSVFLLENSTRTAPIVAYFGPNPPARVPLSHRYTQILVDTSDAEPEDFAALQDAARTLVGFNALTVLTNADLEDKVVAGNFYNVTNPGPVNGTAGGAGGAGGGGASTTSGSGAPQPTNGATGLAAVNGALVVGAMVAAMFFAL